MTREKFVDALREHLIHYGAHSCAVFSQGSAGEFPNFIVVVRKDDREKYDVHFSAVLKRRDAVLYDRCFRIEVLSGEQAFGDSVVMYQETHGGFVDADLAGGATGCCEDGGGDVIGELREVTLTIVPDPAPEVVWKQGDAEGMEEVFAVRREKGVENAKISKNEGLDSKILKVLRREDGRAGEALPWTGDNLAQMAEFSKMLGIAQSGTDLQVYKNQGTKYWGLFLRGGYAIWVDGEKEVRFAGDDVFKEDFEVVNEPSEQKKFENGAAESEYILVLRRGDDTKGGTAIRWTGGNLAQVRGFLTFDQIDAHDGSLVVPMDDERASEVNAGRLEVGSYALWYNNKRYILSESDFNEQYISRDERLLEQKISKDSAPAGKFSHYDSQNRPVFKADPDLAEKALQARPKILKVVRRDELHARTWVAQRWNGSNADQIAVMVGDRGKVYVHETGVMQIDFGDGYSLMVFRDHYVLVTDSMIHAYDEERFNRYFEEVTDECAAAPEGTLDWFVEKIHGHVMLYGGRDFRVAKHAQGDPSDGLFNVYIWAPNDSDSKTPFYDFLHNAEPDIAHRIAQAWVMTDLDTYRAAIKDAGDIGPFVDKSVKSMNAPASETADHGADALRMAISTRKAQIQKELGLSDEEMAKLPDWYNKSMDEFSKLFDQNGSFKDLPDNKKRRLLEGDWAVAESAVQTDAPRIPGMGVLAFADDLAPHAVIWCASRYFVAYHKPSSQFKVILEYKHIGTFPARSFGDFLHDRDPLMYIMCTSPISDRTNFISFESQVKDYLSANPESDWVIMQVKGKDAEMVACHWKRGDVINRGGSISDPYTPPHQPLPTAKGGNPFLVGPMSPEEERARKAAGVPRPDPESPGGALYIEPFPTDPAIKPASMDIAPVEDALDRIDNILKNTSIKIAPEVPITTSLLNDILTKANVATSPGGQVWRKNDTGVWKEDELSSGWQWSCVWDGKLDTAIKIAEKLPDVRIKRFGDTICFAQEPYRDFHPGALFSWLARDPNVVTVSRDGVFLAFLYISISEKDAKTRPATGINAAIADFVTSNATLHTAEGHSSGVEYVENVKKELERLRDENASLVEKYKSRVAFDKKSAELFKNHMSSIGYPLKGSEAATTMTVDGPHSSPLNDALCERLERQNEIEQLAKMSPESLARIQEQVAEALRRQAAANGKIENIFQRMAGAIPYMVIHQVIDLMRNSVTNGTFDTRQSEYIEKFIGMLEQRIPGKESPEEIAEKFKDWPVDYKIPDYLKSSKDIAVMDTGINVSTDLGIEKKPSSRIPQIFSELSKGNPAWELLARIHKHASGLYGWSLGLNVPAVTFPDSAMEAFRASGLYKTWIEELLGDMATTDEKVVYHEMTFNGFEYEYSEIKRWLGAGVAWKEEGLLSYMILPDGKTRVNVGDLLVVYADKSYEVKSA